MPLFPRILFPGLCGAALLPLFSADQPQWGEAWGRNMVSAERGLPDSFDLENRRNVKWIADLGSESHSTPVIAGGRVYIGTNNAEPRDPRHRGDRGVVMCLDERDGHLLWQLVVPTSDTSEAASVVAMTVATVRTRRTGDFANIWLPPKSKRSTQSSFFARNAGPVTGPN